MSLLLWCLVAAALLVVLSKAPSALAMKNQTSGYDNQHPRAQQAALTGSDARAVAAHQNTVETFPLFAAGVLVALMFAPASALSSALAVIFIVSRVVYIWLYVKNYATARSLVWNVGFLACLGLLLAPLYGA